MLKKILFAIAPLCLLASGAFASDNLLDEVASLNADSINTAEIAIEDINLDLDVDALAADTDNGEDAIEACFRRFYGCYNYGCYNYGCYNYYRPCYSYYYCYRPVYTYCYTPCYYHYWGCY